jgi:hypothetical protein
MSSIEITDNNLSPVNYEGLLKAIGKALQDLATSDRYLHARETHFSFDVDKVAEHVALQFKNSNKFPLNVWNCLIGIFAKKSRMPVTIR